MSTAFTQRLSRLTPGQQLRAVLLLHLPNIQPVSRRQTPEERSSAISKVKEHAAVAIGEVESILRQHGGRSLKDNPSALGHLAVETTAEGLKALARSPMVDAILEDQPVVLAR